MSVSENRWFIAALACILGGYVLLAVARDIYVAPVLLVLGYCILLPVHLWVRHRSDDRVGE